MQSHIIRVKEASERLGISIPTLYRWHASGMVPIKKIRLGKNVVGYNSIDFEKWINGELEQGATK